MFAAFFERASDIRRAGSAALDLAYVAAGRLDGFWEIGLSPWDIAAGALLVCEAGGLISDFTAGEVYLDSGNVATATPKLLREIEPLLTPALRRYHPGIALVRTPSRAPGTSRHNQIGRG